MPTPMLQFQVYRKWRDGWQACGSVWGGTKNHALAQLIARDKRFPHWYYKLELIAQTDVLGSITRPRP